MTLHKRILIGSVSGMAMATAVAAAPVFAADPSTPVQEVVVTGIRQSLEKAIQVKRKADEQVDAISATDIGKLPDRNVADALQRLPGVNTTSAASGEGGFDENDRVSIRGTSPSLTQVLVDGHMVSTGDWFILDQFQTVGRSVSFDLLPSEIVQQAEVYKTQNAQLLEGGVAGEVNIETRNPLGLGKDFTIEASIQDSYNSLSKENKPQLNGLFGWKSPDGNLGVILQGFSEDRSVERFGQETLGYEPIMSSMPIGAAFPQTVGAQAPTLIGSTWFKQEKKRDGGYGAVEWRADQQARFRAERLLLQADSHQLQRQLHVLGRARAGHQHTDQRHGREQHPDRRGLACRSGRPGRRQHRTSRRLLGKLLCQPGRQVSGQPTS